MSYYDNNAEEYIKSTINLDMSKLYEEFCRYLPPRAYVLDAGCGPGRDTAEFLRRGYKVDAFDKSKTMVNFSKKRNRIDVKCSSFETVNYGKKFDGIWCCASLLHVSLDNLPAAIKNLAKHLKVNGVIYMSFKYGNGERLKDGRHFTDLTEDSLTDIIKKVEGLDKIKFWKTFDVRPDKSDIWLNAIFKKS